jgi:hypothetical protein
MYPKTNRSLMSRYEIEGDGDEYNGPMTDARLAYLIELQEEENTAAHQSDTSGDEEIAKKLQKEEDESDTSGDEEFAKKFQQELEIKKEEDIIHFHISRSQPRIYDSGEIAFDISYNDTDDWHRVPITQFFDMEEKAISCQQVTDFINDAIEVAKEYPNNKRNCLCCDKKALKSFVLCRQCTPKYESIVYA